MVACSAPRPDVAVAAKKGKAKPVLGGGKGFGATPGGAAGETCPCGGAGPADRGSSSSAPLPYSACCKPYVSGEKSAESPLRLLRSRFSAYSKGVAPYLIRTTHKDHPAQREGLGGSTYAADVQVTTRSSNSICVPDQKYQIWPNLTLMVCGFLQSAGHDRSSTFPQAGGHPGRCGPVFDCNVFDC